MEPVLRIDLLGLHGSHTAPSLQPQSMIELAGESNGIYFVRIENGDQSMVRKVVLAK